jgi:regulator of replication initiation timing
VKKQEPTLDILETKVNLLLETVHEMHEKIQSLLAENILLKRKIKELKND